MSNPWFRTYVDLIDNPKFIKLGPDLARALLMMWCVAGQNDGTLPPIEDIAIKFRTSEARAQKLIDELEHSGWIDRTETGLTPHNWNERQYKSDVSSNRVKQFRERRRNVSETPPEQNRAEQKQNRTDIAADAAPPSVVKVYAFEDGLIRLTAKDFSKWEQSFPRLDLRAEMLSLSKWAAEQGPENWFHAVKGALAKRNRDAKTATDAAAQLRLLPSGNRLPEGIT